MGVNVTGPFRVLVAVDGTIAPYFGPVPPCPDNPNVPYTSTYLMENIFPAIAECPRPFPEMHFSAYFPMESGMFGGLWVSWTEEVQDGDIFLYLGGVPEQTLVPGFWANFRKCKEIGA